MGYLLEANVFIQAKNLHYGFDFCPAFWDWLEQKHELRDVLSIEKVGDELQNGGDELALWARRMGRKFFVPPDPETLPAFSNVAEWVAGRDYEPLAVNAFLQDADYYVVVQALASKRAVVTHEVHSNSKKRIKIPDVCVGLGLKCLTPFEMLRHEGARFVLG